VPGLVPALEHGDPQHHAEAEQPAGTEVDIGPAKVPSPESAWKTVERPILAASPGVWDTIPPGNPRMTTLIGDDCTVEILGRSGLRFRQNSRSVFVGGEMLFGESDFVVTKSSIQSWEGLGESIDADTRDRIVASITATFQKHRMRVDID
jgi:hypothetical protein